MALSATHIDGGGADDHVVPVAGPVCPGHADLVCGCHANTLAPCRRQCPRNPRRALGPPHSCLSVHPARDELVAGRTEDNRVDLRCVKLQFIQQSWGSGHSEDPDEGIGTSCGIKCTTWREGCGEDTASTRARAAAATQRRDPDIMLKGMIDGCEVEDGIVIGSCRRCFTVLPEAHARVSRGQDEVLRVETARKLKQIKKERISSVCVVYICVRTQNFSYWKRSHTCTPYIHSVDFAIVVVENGEAGPGSKRPYTHNAECVARGSDDIIGAHSQVCDDGTVAHKHSQQLAVRHVPHLDHEVVTARERLAAAVGENETVNRCAMASALPLLDEVGEHGWHQGRACMHVEMTHPAHGSLNECCVPWWQSVKLHAKRSGRAMHDRHCCTVGNREPTQGEQAFGRGQRRRNTMSLGAGKCTNIP
eukprot:m.119282 g.119282  ORF g.119282 m.119282 type:complete len:420 (-) comp14525_c1_seq5:315-1574(-)